jgi:hypothetical protein
VSGWYAAPHRPASGGDHHTGSAQRRQVGTGGAAAGGAGRCVRRALERGAALGGAVPLGQRHPEALGEPGRVHRARLGAEAVPEGVVPVPGVFGGGQ